MRTKNDVLRMKLDAGGAAPLEEKPHVYRAFTHHYRFRVGVNSSVDVDAVVPGAESCKRARHTALKLVVRGARSDHLANRKCQQVSYA